MQQKAFFGALGLQRHEGLHCDNLLGDWSIDVCKSLRTRFEAVFAKSVSYIELNLCAVKFVLNMSGSNSLFKSVLSKYLKDFPKICLRGHSVVSACH